MWQSGKGVGQQIWRMRVQILEVQVRKKVNKIDDTTWGGGITADGRGG